MVLMGCHLLKSVILKATAQCAVFSGDPSLKGEAQMATVFYEAVEIIWVFFLRFYLLTSSPQRHTLEIPHSLWL